MKNPFGAIPVADTEALPPAEMALAPTSIEETAQALRIATDHRMKVLVWGGGNHQGYGHRTYPDVVLTTTSLDRIQVWEPEDLTLVAEAGVPIAKVEQMLGEHRQTTLLPVHGETATIGGALATGLSGYQRFRYGPSRDRVLETTAITGDGRTVRAGGRVVKNVTGYDIPRLMVGSMGRLGLIGAVCLKLVPTPSAAVTVTVDDPAAAQAALYRPLAILSTPTEHRAFLWGTPAEVESQAASVGTDLSNGLAWPAPPSGLTTWSLRVPPSCLQEAIDRLPPSWDYVAQHGVGLVECGTPDLDLQSALELREWSESQGGAMVLAGGPETLYEQIDPWGTPPTGLDYQRRLVAEFDPYGVLNPGRLPGGI
ncbi:MAG: FAD-binding oxidoreductase [Actinomycetia bacterium]|nr:FAD-binding oxidoreductase [Actinomycetes bacterium]